MNDLYLQEVINPGDGFSKMGREVCFQSHKNNRAINVIAHQPDNFRGPVGFLWKKHILQEMMKSKICPDTGKVLSWTVAEEIENDGAGGKPQFFTLVGTPEVFSNLGWEIITMTADDFSRSGRLPVVMSNDIQIKYVNDKNYLQCQELMFGYGRALRESGLVNITGEVAIMKHSITSFCDKKSDDQTILTWGGNCVGLAHKDLLIDGSQILPNMPIVGFSEPGYRCNGGTFFTNLILSKWGPEIGKIMENKEAMAFVEKLTTPSKSYAKTISRILGWNHFLEGVPVEKFKKDMIQIAGIAHITGGGVWGKFKEILPKGVGAVLYDMPKPADVLLEAQEMSQSFPNLAMSDYDAYGTFHGGCGMLLVVRSMKDAYELIQEAKVDGIKADIVGITSKDMQGRISINSKFGSKKVLRSAIV
jgi:phosphoribosylformylglycinamidine cyclo-ligase